MADQSPILPAPTPQAYEASAKKFWPIATWVLIALNFVVFGLEIHLGGADNNGVLLNLGAAFGPYLRRGEYWRLVMPIFLHAGWDHILGNTIVLYLLGRIMERLYGYGRYLTIYIASGMGGALLSMMVGKNVAVGASGAILGVAGALFTAGFLYSDTLTLRWKRALGFRLVPFILLVLVVGFTEPNIDNWGHVGGLMAGALMARMIPPPWRDSLEGEPAEVPSHILVILPLTLVLLAGIATLQNFRVTQKMDHLLLESQRYEDSHQYALELQTIQQALRVAPKNEFPHEQMGLFYLTEKKFDAAMEEFQKAIQLSGGDNNARLQLGLAYELKGDPSAAERIFESVLGEDPQTPQGRALLASNHTTLGALYAQQKHYAQAVSEYQQALVLNPNWAEAQNNLAWLYATCDDPQFRKPDESLVLAQRAVELTKWKEATLIDTLAEAHYVKGEFAQAVEIQRKAIALDPANKELQDHMEKYRHAVAI